MVRSYLCKGKRRSITGVRKRVRKTATLGASAMRSVAVGSSLLAHPVSANTPRPRQLISTLSPPSDKSLSSKREADRVIKQRKGVFLAFISSLKKVTGPGLKAANSFISRVKHVSQEVIRSKWAVLGEDTRAQVEELLRSVELPVLAHYSSEQGKIEAQLALRSITET